MFLFTGFMACSVEEVEEDSEFGFQELDAVVEIQGCDVVSFDYDQAGHIEVTNDQDSLYISIISADNHLLHGTKLHIANSYDDFPTVGQGNLPPGQMDQQENFSPEVERITYSYSLSEYDKCIYVASYSSFISGSENISSWAGDISGKKGNWSYFQYCIQDCVPTCDVNAGSDNSMTISLSQANAIADSEEVRELYLSLLDNGVSREGSFKPSIVNRVFTFHSEGAGDYPTVYTVGEGECTDSAILTIRVIADPED